MQRNRRIKGERRTAAPPGAIYIPPETVKHRTVYSGPRSMYNKPATEQTLRQETTLRSGPLLAAVSLLDAWYAAANKERWAFVAISELLSYAQRFCRSFGMYADAPPDFAMPSEAGTYSFLRTTHHQLQSWEADLRPVYKKHKNRAADLFTSFEEFSCAIDNFGSLINSLHKPRGAKPS